MEFDKSKVYTALNADELPIGSKCIFADTVKGLRRKVEEPIDCVETFHRLHSDGGNDSFVGSDGVYCYAYLIDPPPRHIYKPFESGEKAMKTIKKHGGWVEDEGTGCKFLVLGYGIHKEDFSIYIKSEWTSLEDLFMDYVFANDGSPCGEIALEETKNE